MNKPQKTEQRDTQPEPSGVYLTFINFFVYLWILLGIFDSLKALHQYHGTPNEPIISISFLLTVVLAYGLIGYLWSMPIRISQLIHIKKTGEQDFESGLRWASAFLVPLLIIPVVVSMLGRLLIIPTSLSSLVRPLAGIIMLIFYGWLIYSGSKVFFNWIIRKAIPLWKIIFVEFNMTTAGYLILAGFTKFPMVLSLILIVILAVLSFFILRGRFSPCYNLLTRNIFRVASLIFIILPGALGLFQNEKSEGVKTRDGNGNIIVISIDALRWDYLSAYGSKDTRTPNINRFAETGVVFDKLYSVAPWTVSSVSSLATGVYPSVHGANVRTYRIQNGVPTLAENLRERGFTTGAFFVNPLMGLPSGLQNGFDGFYEPYTLISPYKLLFFPRFYYDKVFIPLCYKRYFHYDLLYVELMEKKLFPWIMKNKDKKVFLWVHYFDPHAPYGPPDRYLKRDNPKGDGKIKFASYNSLLDILFGLSKPSEKTAEGLKDLYAGDIDFVDERVGMLFDKLKEAGWMENATIIITSDHGEEFYDHKSFEHGHTFYEELLHVPLIIQTGLGVEPIPLGREKIPLDMLDLTATIADIAGLQILPFYQDLQGTSIYENSDTSPEDEIFFFEETNRGFPGRIAVIYDGFKFIIHEDNTISEVYNLVEDPFEKMNLVAQLEQTNLKIKALQYVQAWRDQNTVLKRKLRTTPDAADEEAKINQKLLQGLGYFK